MWAHNGTRRSNTKSSRVEEHLFLLIILFPFRALGCFFGCFSTTFFFSSRRNEIHLFFMFFRRFQKACSHCFRHVHFNIFCSLLRKLRVNWWWSQVTAECRDCGKLPVATWKINFIIVQFNNSFPAHAKSKGLRNPLKSFFHLDHRHSRVWRSGIHQHK